ncbi:C1 family peptidase [Chryseobacterium scophthalmum]|uniref:C1 family peptidase n=1 Tax=Chryseobacterium scophthalmum TaxID=59733 RepID=UPI003D088CCA
MKNIKLFFIALGIMSINSCNQDSTDLNESLPQEDAQKFQLGAKLVDEDTYNSFQRIDMNELAMEYKGKNISTLAKSFPTSYTMISPPVGNQGREGSCVAWAIAYAALSSMDFNFNGPVGTSTRSPEYMFNQIKVGNTCTAGSYITSGMNLAKNQGVCGWNEMYYTDAGCSTQPNASQRAAAKAHRFQTWGTADKTNIEGIKAAISMNFPIILGIKVDQSFYDMQYTGWIWKSHYGKFYGGHAVCVIGYDDSKNAFKVQNSWGTSWGDSGYFWIDYDFFKKTTNGAATEAYVATML